MTDSDKVAAALAGMRERNDQWIASMALTEASVNDSPFGDLRRALAAVEAVLEMHQPGRIMVLGALCKDHEGYRHFSITSTEAARNRACPDCAATANVSCFAVTRPLTAARTARPSPGNCSARRRPMTERRHVPELRKRKD